VSSIRLGLLPTTASLASSGIVTVPGMMAGQIIAGGNPIDVSSIRLGLLPTTASLASSGIVTVPGMMAGQIIAGGNPIDAAKYQFLILAAIAALTLLADSLIMVMAYRKCFTADDQYNP
ncbi:ABC transporter permease, partial [Algiphilus sp. NNCM1]|nr:ABC transporter permease [Algiphilus acroporae]